MKNVALGVLLTAVVSFCGCKQMTGGSSGGTSSKEATRTQCGKVKPKMTKAQVKEIMGGAGRSDGFSNTPNGKMETIKWGKCSVTIMRGRVMVANWLGD